MAWSTNLWLLCAPVLTLGFVALGLVVPYLLRHDSVALFALFPVAILVLMLRLRLATPGARARLLSGNSPFGCFHAPRTPEAFVERLCEVWQATGRRPTVVGSGWGFFIARAHARDAVFTHKLKGKVGAFTFLAGTELRTVEATIRKEHGRTFWSTPTMQRISIGSWLARSCHGNSGAAGKPSSYAASRVLVVDLATRETACAGTYWAEYGTIKHDFDKFPGRFAIVAVSFAPERMPTNFWLQKSRADVRPSLLASSQGLREWLTREAVLRVLFFGWARSDLAIGVTYVEFRPEEGDLPDVRRECLDCCGREVPHIDPHDCSASCMSLQLDTCSLICGWYETAKRSWRGVIKLSDANAFSPDPSWLGFPIVSILSGTVNFELIFLLPQLVAPSPRTQEFRVQKLCNTLFDLYKKVWGRSELRMASLDKGLVFVDCIVREHDVAAVVAAIQPHVHANTVALHDAKFQGDSLKSTIQGESPLGAGLFLVTPRAVFGMS
tara:strand:- start:1615 stop:3102 length:1488 start_codon:yes stop_codon:yes gene_type:complete